MWLTSRQLSLHTHHCYILLLVLISISNTYPMFFTVVTIVLQVQFHLQTLILLVSPDRCQCLHNRSLIPEYTIHAQEQDGFKYNRGHN